jgi:hypothetical protein
MTKEYPIVIISEQMISEARKLIPSTKVNRTVASEIDTLTGHLGEFAFAQYFYNDYHMNRVGENRGDVDFLDIEIKTSSFPFSENLNLLVREDYALKRHPPFYVQIIIDVLDSKARDIIPGTKAFIAGFATANDVDRAPKRDFGSKLGGKGGYSCYYISIRNLKPMADFREAYERRS